MEDNTDSGDEVGEILKQMLHDGREQRLAYLLFHCGLKPREILRFCPQEFGDMQEVYRVRRNVVKQLLRRRDYVRWRLKTAVSDD